jgi:fructose-1-phosphate kinase PfkB-like protein
MGKALAGRINEGQDAIDFTVMGGGSVYLLRPNTEEAEAWVEEHIPEDAMMMGNAIAVEHRYIADIVVGIQNDGLTVE